MDATKLIRVGFDGEIQNELDYNDITVKGLRKKLCKQYLTTLDKAKITGISLI